MSENKIKGILNTKLSMTQILGEENRAVPVTVVGAGPYVVTQVRTRETDGYDAAQTAYGEIDPRRINESRADRFKKAGMTPCRYSVEIHTPDASPYEVGQSAGVDTLGEIEHVDATGISKGRGFVGGMKRYGFVGQGAAHGNQAAHRRVGGTDAYVTLGRAFRGKRMVDHMGNSRVTTQNPKIQKVDADANLLLIKGAVPGARGDLLVVKTATKDGAHV